MQLGLLAGITDPRFGDAEVTGFAIDHRKVAPGAVFGAFPGSRFNGEDFIGEAVTRGAVAAQRRRPGQDGADDTGHRHLSPQHGRHAAHGDRACRL
jgi:UDP-N-acetylmuramoyl-L-alanyl-D-glutamate--2,6-diaminopimelate ligase